MRHEMERILEEQWPAPALIRAAELGVLAEVSPSLARVEAVEQLAGGGRPLAASAEPEAWSVAGLPSSTAGPKVQQTRGYNLLDGLQGYPVQAQEP